MKIDNVSMAGANLLKQEKPSEVLDAKRKEKEEPKAEPMLQNEKDAVPPEEILQKIKELTDNGTYSVRFEMDESVKQMVVRVVDKESGDQIRQVPADELLKAFKHLREFRGLLVDTQR